MMKNVNSVKDFQRVNTDLAPQFGYVLAAFAYNGSRDLQGKSRIRQKNPLGEDVGKRANGRVYTDCFR